MAETIKGINVVIGAETTGLSKALSEVNKQSRNIQSELKQVNKALKFDPSNTTLLTQKQTLLGKSIETTKGKLEQLKSVQQQVQQQFASGEISEGQYRAFQREIETTQNKLNGLEKQLKTSSSELQSFGVKAAEAGAKLNKIGSGVSSAGKTLTLGITAPLVGAAAAAVKVGNDFETSMSQAAGALNKPMAQMGSLRELALKTGQDTQFSATEAGNAITELAKGGLTEAQIKGGALKATMDLAASSGMELGTAANTVVQAMGAFGLSASQSAQAVNALAGAAAASSTDVEPLTQGLAQCAAQANLVGWSIQDTTAVLGEFADAGVVGSDAGTSLKTMLQRLGAPADKAAEAMDSLGINVWDSNGHMKNAAGIAQELQNKMSGLSDAQKQSAMNTIFGSDATRAASILMKNGAAGLEKYTKATNDQTAASRLAASQMGDTSKAIEQMLGALETAGIRVQEALAPTITSIAKTIGNLATAFSNLSPVAQKIILIVAGIVAAIGPLLMILGPLLITIGTVAGAIGVVATGATAATPAIRGLALVIRGVMTVFTAITSPIGIAIASIAAIGLVVYQSVTHWDTLKTTISNFVANLPTLISTAVASISQFISTLVTAITTNLPQIMAMGSQILNTIITAITTNLPQIMTTGTQIITSIVTAITTYLPQVLTIGGQIITSIITAIVNNLPQLINTGLQIITTLITGILNNVSQILTIGTEMITEIVEAIVNNLPQIIDTATQIITTLVTAISAALPNLIAAGLAIILALASAIIQNLPQIINSALQIIMALVNGITQNLPQIIAAAVKIILMLAQALIQNLPQIIIAAIQIIVAIVKGLAQALPQLVSYAPQIIGALGKAIKSLASQAIEWGKHLIQNLIDGIKSKFGPLGEAVGWIADKISSLLHHTTPDEGPLKDDDKWMPDMMKNLADGIKNNTGIVMSAINNLVKGISNKTSLIKDELTSVNSWLSDFTDALKNGLNDAAFYLNNSAIKLGTALADAVMPERNARSKYFDDYNNGVITADRAITELDGSISQLQNSTGDYETDLRNLMGVMTHQSTQVNILTSEYNKLAAQFGTNSDKAVEALKKVQDLRDAYQKTGKDIKELTEKFKDALIDDVNDVNDKIKDSLKQRYEDEKDAAEKQIKLATDTQTKILQAKIDAISDQESQLDSQYQDEDDADKEAELRRQLNMHWGAEKKKELQDELNDLIKTRERRHQKEQLDQQKQSLQDQIDQLKAQQETSLSNIADFYDQKLSDANLEAEAEKTLMNSTQQDLVALLHSYGEDYKLVGQDLGTRLVEGFEEPLSNLQSMFDNLKNALSEIQNAGVIPTSASFQNAASSLNLAAAATTGTQSINLEASQPTTIITPVYLEGEQVAKITTPYTSRIQGKNIALNGRGL